jgi:ABC-type transport system involved in multi-copper enzyme maturation permease subunit
VTVLTLPARDRPAPDSALRPLPWRRMAWVTWRQHRPTLIAVPAVLAAVAAFLLIAGLKTHHDYAALTACHPAGATACQALNSSFNSTDWHLADGVNILLQLAPALIGAFAGAPVLARELETGTFRYAWTQGFGRERMTIAKLVLLGVTITALAGAFSTVFAWFFQPVLDQQQNMTVLTATVFDTRGIAFAAWTLAAFSIGAFAGMLIRRILPAMAVTLGAYLGLNLLAWLVLRKNYPVAVVTSNPALLHFGQFSLNTPWVLSTWTSGGTTWWRIIPVSRFWPMQFIEGGWLLALSVLLIAATAMLVRRRAA